MIVDDDNFISIKVKEESSMLYNPGSAYLRIMQYYSEEKNYNKIPNTIKNWEIFIEKYFCDNVEMNIKILDKEKIFYEISNIFN
jgi:Fic family protein